MINEKDKAKELYDKFLPLVRQSDLYDTYHNKVKNCVKLVCQECIKEHCHESEHKDPNAQDRWIDFWQEVERQVSLL